jgi:acetyl-CoA carboxylase biotin carboxyl carrier protein
MESKIQKLIEVLRLFENSEFTELHVEADGTKIDLAKGDTFAFSAGHAAGVLTDPSPVSPATATTAGADTQHTERVELRAAEGLATRLVPDKPEASDPMPVAPVDQELIAIRSPTLGNFYRAPSPGEPSYVELEDRVSKHDTVCLIECMKLFNTIEAGCDGVVVNIAAENGQMVEFGQLLMYIRPD